MADAEVIDLEEEKARRIEQLEAEFIHTEAIEGSVYIRYRGELLCAMTPGAAESFGHGVLQAAESARGQGESC